MKKSLRPKGAFERVELSELAEHYPQLHKKILKRFHYPKDVKLLHYWGTMYGGPYIAYKLSKFNYIYLSDTRTITFQELLECDKPGIGVIFHLAILYKYEHKTDFIVLNKVVSGDKLKDGKIVDTFRGFEFYVKFLGIGTTKEEFIHEFSKYETKRDDELYGLDNITYKIPIKVFNKYVEKEWK